MNIVDFIPEGKENAISTKDLCSLTESDPRTLRKHIEKARNSGAVICSSLTDGGYFIPRSPSEAVDYVHEETLRIASAKRALESAIKFVGEEDGDTT